MRIAINAQLLFFEKSFRNAGVSRYIYNLIQGLSKIDSRNEYFIFVNKTFQPFVNNKNFHFIKSEINTTMPIIRIFWEQVILPFLLLKYRIDVFHSTMHVLPLFCPVKSIVTVHDLSFVKRPETHTSKRNFYQKIFTKISAKSANKIIANSQSTKKDIQEYAGIPQEKISITYLAAGKHFRCYDEKKVKAFQKEKSLNFPFILCVGTLEPRKNLKGTINAYFLLKQKKKRKEKLVIAGGKGWNYDKIFNLTEKLDSHDNIVFTGYVADEELPLLYNAAKIFVYPSLHEGFGLPSLEAMQCGCPVITSNRSSLPEVVGDAAIKINPYDVKELATAMERLLNNDKLRKALIKRGLAQAEKFNWEKTARETLAVYEGLNV